MHCTIPALRSLHPSPGCADLAAMFINVGLNFLFFIPLQNGGPALATSLAAIFNSIALLAIFRRRYGRIGMRGLVTSCAKFAVASLAMGIIAAILIRVP